MMGGGSHGGERVMEPERLICGSILKLLDFISLVGDFCRNQYVA